jgi:hypothetical protein
MVTSSNGYAQVMLNSGTQSGIMSVKASCTDAGHYATAMQSAIVVHAGPAHRIEPFAGGYNTGEAMGGGLWRIVAGAHLYDVYDNPVDYGTSVWFSIPNNQYNCQIVANAYVGNESVEGDSTAGTAYTSLIYSGFYSLETITIRAETGGINGQEVFGEADIILPLNQPQVEIEIIPGNLVFHGNTYDNPESATADLNASVFDSQGNPIHNARILLSSTRGTFEPILGTNRDPQNCNPHAQPYVIVTDWYDADAIYEWYYDPYYQIPGGPDINAGLDGLAKGLIRFFNYEVPLYDPYGNPSVTSVTITAHLMGTDATSQSTITLIRYPT